MEKRKISGQFTADILFLHTSLTSDLHPSSGSHEGLQKPHLNDGCIFCFECEWTEHLLFCLRKCAERFEELVVVVMKTHIEVWLLWTSLET